ncbi:MULTISPECIES: hypothetical protein [Rhodomicrobium]|uniref:hypothetical protein n=1 Tax=Rhodomicrobium TaxID=1068 RepID=UPI000B4A9460|nr:MULTISPECIES: hypothetical protein [Rhodomicrobium]
MALLDAITGANSGNSGDSGMTPDAIELRRKLALAMLGQSQSDPVKSTPQGLNSVAKALISAYQINKLDKADKTGQTQADNLLMSVFGGGAPAAPMSPSSGPPPSFAKPAPSANTLTGAIVGAESAGDPDATNPMSSATGRGQFIASTWEDLMKRHKSDLIAGKTRQQILDMRRIPELSDELTGIYSSEIQADLTKAGFEPTPSNTYLGYFLGPDSAKKVLKANPNTPLVRLLPADTLRANPFLIRMTAGGVQDMTGKKMAGVTTDGAAASAQPVNLSDNPAQAANVQRAVALMRNPRTAAIGQAMLAKIATTDVSPQQPVIIKVPGENGEEVSMVWNRRTGGLDPISSLTGTPSGPQLEPIRLAAASGAAGAPQTDAAPMAPAVRPQPIQAVAPPSAPPQAAAPMLGGNMPTENIGEVGPSSLMVQSNIATKGNMLPNPAQAGAPAPAAAPAITGEVPEGAQRGPAAKKVPDGYIHRQAPGGGFLYDANARPIFELKSEADARAKGTEKREEARRGEEMTQRQVKGDLTQLAQKINEATPDEWNLGAGQYGGSNAGIADDPVTYAIGSAKRAGVALGEQLFGTQREGRSANRLRAELRSAGADLVMTYRAMQKARGVSDSQQSNADLAFLESIVGQLPAANSREEAYAILNESVRPIFERLTGEPVAMPKFQEMKKVKPQGNRATSQTVLEAMTAARGF